MSKLVVIVLLVSIPWSRQEVEDSQYCSLRYRRLCQGKGRHVGCQFPQVGPGEGCQNFTKIKFDNEIKHFIVHYINRRRQRLALGAERVRGGVHIPKPEIMLQVSWDRELAHLAQRLANQCNFVHDDCRATVRYPYAGQTVGEVKWRRSSESDSQSALRAIRRILDAWWGEKRRVQPKHLTQPFRLTFRGNAWGHFSQLAVWNLCAVGCGAVRHVAKYPRLLLVCDFSHTNMLGQKTINPGPLAKCPMHTARRPHSAYPTLCAPVQLSEPLPTKNGQGYHDNYEQESDEEDPIDEYYAEDDPDGENGRNSSLVKGRVAPEIVDSLDDEVYESRTQSTRTKMNREPGVRQMVNGEEYNKANRVEWRPGAKALLANHNPVEDRVRKIISKDVMSGSLKMDQEDIDQLFKDTGFRPNWRDNTKIP